MISKTEAGRRIHRSSKRVVQADTGKRYLGKRNGTGREESRTTRRRKVQTAECLGRERECQEGQGRTE